VAVLAVAAAMATAATATAADTDGGFCAALPTELDTRIAAAVEAMSVSASTTSPIAVVDTGVMPDVPELAGRIVSSFDATSGGNDASDVTGHGTQVAGIAAGAPGLVRGISPTSPVMPVRVFNRSGDTTVQWIIAGINWAVANGAGVIDINSSIAESDATAADIAFLTRATTDAFNKGVLVVSAVGNNGNSAAVLPAALPHVLAVGASDLAGNRTTFSNTGPWVDLVAPATSLVAPVSMQFCPSGYGVANGTSYSAPAVAGAAALIAQLRPTLTPQQRFDLLRTSAHDVAPAGRDEDTGYGLLNVQAALNAPLPPAGSSREVDDDPYYVRGPYATSHPVALGKSRTAKFADTVSPAKDPSDVYRVRLKKGERFFASAAARPADALISLSLWKPAVGDFDVTNEIAKNRIVSSGGFSDTIALKMVAKKSGTYYISVEAPDAIDPDDPTDIPPTTESYKLTLSRQPPLKPKKKSSHKRARRSANS
jgi:Subtilase family